MNCRWCSETAGGVRLAVQISPNAKKNEITVRTEDAIKIKLKAQPVDGKANEALIRYLAEVLDIPKSAVSITHGFTGKKKLLEIRTGQLTAEAIVRILSAAP